MEREGKGKVYIAGAGPCDPELITLKLYRILKAADVILYDHLVNPRILDEAKSDAEKIYVGKMCGKHSVSQDEINALLVDKAKEGRLVLRLKGGDPLIFGRVGEEMRALDDAGVDYEIIPGITASSAAASAAKVPLTHRDFASTVTFVTGHRKKGMPLDLPFSHLAALNGTLVFYMAVSTVSEVAESLIREGMNENTPVLVAYRAGCEDERYLKTTLRLLPEVVRREKIASPAVFIVGQVVEMSPSSSFLFSSNPGLPRRP
ncbi:MAG: uroporphyrinogen-III C-methyltransferase [Deferribacteres bacterium]|nr:uroporphyrinogen-III C-methyltransferase [Deferribacteres bacterium]